MKVRLYRGKRFIDSKIWFRHDTVWGDTKCFIDVYGEDGELVESSVGMANCAPTDRYNKTVGRKIALARAIDVFCDLKKDERRQIWNEYFKTHKVFITRNGKQCNTFLGQHTEKKSVKMAASSGATNALTGFTPNFKLMTPAEFMSLVTGVFPRETEKIKPRPQNE